MKKLVILLVAMITVAASATEVTTEEFEAYRLRREHCLTALVAKPTGDLATLEYLSHLPLGHSLATVVPELRVINYSLDSFMRPLTAQTMLNYNWTATVRRSYRNGNTLEFKLSKSKSDELWIHFDASEKIEPTQRVLTEEYARVVYAAYGAILDAKLATADLAQLPKIYFFTGFNRRGVREYDRDVFVGNLSLSDQKSAEFVVFFNRRYNAAEFPNLPHPEFESAFADWQRHNIHRVNRSYWDRDAPEPGF